MSRRRNRHRGDASPRSGFIRRRDRQGRNHAFVFDLTADRYCAVDESGRVDPDDKLGPDEIRPHLAEDLYDEGDEEGT